MVYIALASALQVLLMSAVIPSLAASVVVVRHDVYVILSI